MEDALLSTTIVLVGLDGVNVKDRKRFFARGMRPHLGHLGIALMASRALPSPRLQAIGGPPSFVLMWYSSEPFVYETMYGGAERALAGRSVQRFSTKAQALAMGRNLLKSAPGVTYSVYRLADGDMLLENSFPKRINVEGARIKFRRRKPKSGGADDSLLGVGGMGDDVWRELIERDSWGSLDEAWSRFRKELELGRALEVVDENGEAIELGGDYPIDEEEEDYD